ncbi:MAG: aryldialkylphosphatase, partial [Chloroflexi bacterium]|nr:aryldialkylphosphatase [Chloroflexota bacterium]
PGIGRDPRGLARVSRITGLNIIMGCGYYTAPSLSPEFAAKPEGQIAEEIIRDITTGVGSTGIRAGLIGEIGCSWPLHDNERKVLRAAAKAQQKTGACLSVHPGRNRQAPFDVVDILERAGADLSRVIICHMEARVRDHEGRTQLLQKGCTLEYDLWGWEGHFPTYWTSDEYMDLPNDTQRVYEVRQHIAEGYLNQIVMSHDICAKTRRVRYGGWGYAHILNYVLPMMRQRGITQGQIEALIIGNPRRLLTFV